MDTNAFKLVLEGMAIPEMLDCLDLIAAELRVREIYGVADSVSAARGHLEDAYKGTWLRSAKAGPRTPALAAPRVGHGEEGLE